MPVYQCVIYGLLEAKFCIMRKIYVYLVVWGLLFAGSARAQDWQNLGRYQEANSQLGMPKPGETRVVFMGNSITEIWMKIFPEFFSSNHYINRGISGQTTPQMLLRFRADVIDLLPKVVVILAGTNDIAGNTGPATLKMIEDNIVSMCELARCHHIRVVLSSVLPVYDYPWHKGLHPAAKIIKLNRWIKKYATENGWVYLDYFTPLADKRDGMKSMYSADGVHPNREGFAVMMPLAKKAIEQALNRK